MNKNIHLQVQRSIRQLRQCHIIATSLTELLIERAGFSWFDGGCYTLADTVHSLVEGVDIFHISRSSSHRDHAVVKVIGADLYFDGDGLATGHELFEKMEHEEALVCTILAPFDDFESKRPQILVDIKERFAEKFAESFCENEAESALIP